jgi:hypothetical protein
MYNSCIEIVDTPLTIISINKQRGTVTQNEFTMVK